MPVPTRLEYGELLDGADLAQDGNGEETELVLEILHCWPPTCREMTSRSCPEKGKEVEPALSFQGCWINVRTVLERFVLTPPLERC